MAKTKLPMLKPRIQLQGDRVQTMRGAGWRAGKNSAQRGYDRRWQRRREAQLRSEPMCAYCARQGFVTPATVADHIVPHRGDPELFENGELQSLCASCHSSAKQREEAQR